MGETVRILMILVLAIFALVPGEMSYRTLCHHWLEPGVNMLAFAYCEKADELRDTDPDQLLWTVRNEYYPLPIAWWQWNLYWQDKEK
jgi:hypothetical protein